MIGNTHAFVTNTKTGESTRYENYGFDHVLKFNGSYYGVKSGGIYLLEGETDDGVQFEASFRTAKNDFNTSLYKRVPYLFVDSDYESKVTPFVDDIEQVEYSSGFDGKRTKIGRGIRGRYWSFLFRSVGGGELRIRGIELMPEVMTRRIS